MNKYSSYSGDVLEEHLSNFLVSSWSYSSVSCFARNEKAFEMQYVYRERGRSTMSAIIGNAYHEALKEYFSAYKADMDPAVVDLTQVAYNYIDNLPANAWMLKGKTPTVETARAEATAKVNTLLSNFCAESSLYTAEIAEVLSVEERFEEWLVINGVDIPLPCHAYLDLVVRLKDGRIVIIDQKSKSAYTAEDEVALVHGQQGITYVKVWESKYPDKPVSGVWFVENKMTRNSDKSPQLRKHVIPMDEDNRRLFEALLYEPLRRMLLAVSDPDYTYTINTADNFVEKAVLYDFWARTQISEVEDFENIPEDKKDLIARRQRKIKDSSIGCIAPKVITAFRKNAASFITLDYSKTDMTQQEKIEHLFRTFNIHMQVAHIIEGFSCDTYLCEVAPGTELLAIFRHSMDVANALDVPRVRIQGEPLVMYEGKSYLAIEVNKKRDRDLPWDISLLKRHKLPIGIDNYNRTVVWDLDNNTTPHALVCGCTGSGKSVCLRSTIHYALAAGIDDVIILDPKYEFADMELPSCVTIHSDIADIEKAIADMVEDMNTRIKERRKRLTLVVFDEFADANDQARSGKQLGPEEKSLQDNFKMLLQKGRSCGFRFMAATQRADTKTISGTIKVNLPVQICFRVPKGLDSKVVIDSEGAETLAGAGDGLMHSPEYPDGLVRFQGFYL